MRVATTIAATVTLGLSLVATGPAGAQHRFDRRQAVQERRIDQGVRSGALTPRETRRLERGQVHVERLETLAEADGVVTPRERLRLDHAQDVQSRQIFLETHDAQHR